MIKEKFDAKEKIIIEGSREGFDLDGFEDTDTRRLGTRFLGGSGRMGGSGGMNSMFRGGI